jgi:hypothetical protein
MSELHNYREEYRLMNLLYMAYKKGLLQNFGEEPEERAYMSANSSMAVRRYGVAALGFTGLVALNAFYVIPRLGN